MIKLRLLIILFFTPYAIFAQAQVSIKIVDTFSKQSVRSATMVLTVDSNTNKSTTFTADSAGQIFLRFENRNYRAKISCIGFKDTTFSFNASQNHIFQLIPKTTTLKEVFINGKKNLIERKIDRTVFNVEASIAAIGSNSFDLLEKVPGVRTQNDVLSLTGKSTVLVTIDNRSVQLSGAELTNFLRSLPSEQISKIEIITNPPASYDAQGNSGIINIITKKNKTSGYNGTIKMSNRTSKYNYSDLGGTFNLNSNKYSLAMSVSTGKGPMQIIQDVDIFYPDQIWRQSSVRKHNLDYLSFNFYGEYKLNSKNTIGLGYIFSSTRPNMTELITNKTFNLGNRIDSILSTNALTHRQKTYNSINLKSSSKITENGGSLNFNFDYLSYIDDNKRSFANLTTVEDQVVGNRNTETNSNQDIDIFTFKADLSIPFKFFDFSSGGKLVFTKTNSSTDLFNQINGKLKIDSAQLNQFSYNENIQALYINGKKNIGKWEFQAGLRGEFTNTKGISFQSGSNSNRYIQLFPTLFGSYKINEDNQVTASYGKRISRPTYESLNPFRWFTSPYTYFEGNPFLRPSFTHNIEFTHAYKNWLNSNLYMSITSNGVDQIAISNDKIVAYQYLNIINSTSIGLIESVTLTPISWWEMYTQIQPYYRKVESTLAIAQNKQTSFSSFFSTSNNFSINRKSLTAISLNLWYQLPEVNGIYKFSSYWNTSVGFKTSLINKRLIAALTANDIFRTQAQSYQGIVNSIPFRFNNYNDSRRLILTLSYKFGNDKLKSSRSKAGNEEERQRLGQ